MLWKVYMYARRDYLNPKKLEIWFEKQDIIQLEIVQASTSRKKSTISRRLRIV